MHRLTKRARALAAPAALCAALLAGCSSTHAAASAHTTPAAPQAARPTGPDPADSAAQDAAFARLESRFHARLGLYAIDTGTGRAVSYQEQRRFAVCSTIKALAAGVLLQRDTDQQLDQIVAYSMSDLVDYSPVLSQHAGTGMTLTAIIGAALDVSDNTALNVMLERIGGPAALQSALRGLGDPTTNVDRTEPTVNSAVPGDERDTSTARALAADLRTFALGDALSPEHRARLAGWLRANTTGGPYIRAAAPPGWTVGDKTGSGDYGTRNDIAVLWPPAGAPAVIAVLSDRGGQADAPSADALIADAAKIALQTLT